MRMLSLLATLICLGAATHAGEPTGAVIDDTQPGWRALAEEDFTRVNSAEDTWMLVNGVEVSGGTACDPAQGYLCLESEGSPILFRRLRIRELP